MKEAGVPLWYIESCQKLNTCSPGPRCSLCDDGFSYSFYKVYYPREFYAGFSA